MTRRNIVRQLGVPAACHQHVHVGLRLSRQQRGDARHPGRAQVLIQPVDNNQQVPACLRCALAGTGQQAPEFREAWNRRVHVHQVSQLRHQGRQEPVAVGISFPAGKEIRDHVHARRAGCRTDRGHQRGLASPRVTHQPSVTPGTRGEGGQRGKFRLPAEQLRGPRLDLPHRRPVGRLGLLPPGRKPAQGGTLARHAQLRPPCAGIAQARTPVRMRRIPIQGTQRHDGESGRAFACRVLAHHPEQAPVRQDRCPGYP